VTITAEKTKELVAELGTGDNDTGAAPVQIAILTERIRNLTEHLRANAGDFGSRRGLLKMIGKRRRLQAYYQRNNPLEYAALIKRLGLRR
jgi:small subunit ribosomal protein S15